MRQEFSAGTVVFRRYNNRIEFLLLKHSVGHWSHPKGHIEPGETPEQAMARELAEETGIKTFEIVEPRLGKIEYTFRDRNGLIHKEVVFSLIQVPSNVKVKLSNEHVEYGWYPPQKAIQKASYEGDKFILKEAIKTLKDKFELQ